MRCKKWIKGDKENRWWHTCDQCAIHCPDLALLHVMVGLYDGSVFLLFQVIVIFSCTPLLMMAVPPLATLLPYITAPVCTVSSWSIVVGGRRSTSIWSSRKWRCSGSRPREGKSQRSRISCSKHQRSPAEVYGIQHSASDLGQLDSLFTSRMWEEKLLSAVALP